MKVAKKLAHKYINKLGFELIRKQRQDPPTENHEIRNFKLERNNQLVVIASSGYSGTHWLMRKLITIDQAIIFYRSPEAILVFKEKEGQKDLVDEIFYSEENRIGVEGLVDYINSSGFSNTHFFAIHMYTFSELIPTLNYSQDHSLHYFSLIRNPIDLINSCYAQSLSRLHSADINFFYGLYESIHSILFAFSHTLKELGVEIDKIENLIFIYSCLPVFNKIETAGIEEKYILHSEKLRDDMSYMKSFIEKIMHCRADSNKTISINKIFNLKVSPSSHEKFFRGNALQYYKKTEKHLIDQNYMPLSNEISAEQKWNLMPYWKKILVKKILHSSQSLYETYSRIYDLSYTDSI